ncbi:DUF1822 family protein [Gloeocapsopsis dulcis]|uniref:DUF1822 domain-containing protein n=1 Tax=Gloeocapsopsis dulcis AAB1 = 1H9 TaxID=1433147 RepID=A0A6N8FSC0_9CHRO|nr:DUF1822 family protein [Gloeocapsopsis dulcis]MUL35644.1 hypothetical protein [Gloeocapsopsis dulcis AAB1 = 1H9]WNN87456.1 DUF1822 family protein [Gloeocapsopsis dulcis]
MTENTKQIQGFALPLPITQVAQETAQEFTNEVQGFPDKVEKIKFNTLAVCIVDNYLQMMGINTNITAGDSWNPVLRLCADIADLEVTGVGRLECRWVRLPSVQCDIPPEVWEDRIGYVVVQFEETLREATLLGFTPKAIAQLPINALQPPEDLLAHLNELKLAAENRQLVVQLSQWFNRVFETGWQGIETILGPARTNLVFSFRRSDPLVRETNKSREERVQRAKLIDLGMQLAGHAVALIVELRSVSDQKMDILLQVHPTGSQIYLPPQLQLTVLDASEAVFLEAQARKADNYIQLQFSGNPGEKFSVRVALGSDSMIENFMI